VGKAPTAIYIYKANCTSIFTKKKKKKKEEEEEERNIKLHYRG
jgi:hypothetical protein